MMKQVVNIILFLTGFASLPNSASAIADEMTASSIDTVAILNCQALRWCNDRPWKELAVDSSGRQNRARGNENYVNAVKPVETETTLFAIKALSLNSDRMDFSPFPYKNGLAFVSARVERTMVPAEDETFLSLFYAEELEDGTFTKPELLNQGNTTSYHEGPSVFFDGGKRKIVTRNAFVKKRKLGDGDKQPLELAESHLISGNEWSPLVPIKFATKEFSVGHPAISSDGRTLYFSSDMPGTLGGSDLFVSKYENGTWSSPQNMGAKINTTGHELFPYLHNDSILYFASDGREGMGGLDLFACDLTDGQRTIAHLPPPLNSSSDDFGMILETKGTSGFFSSNRPGGVGQDDIYYFEQVQRYVRIQLYDSISHQYIPNSRLSLTSDGRTVAETSSDLAGRSEVRLAVGRSYTLTLFHEGYGARQFEFLNPVKGGDSNPMTLNIYLNPLKQKSAFRNTTTVPIKQRQQHSNIISFSSAPLDVDVQPPAPSAEPVKPEKDSVVLPAVKVITVEIVNNLPAVMIDRDNELYELRPTSASTLENAEIGVRISMPHGAKRSDFEKIISEQLNQQGLHVSGFLLIRSFFFDSESTLIRNDASAQLDKIIEAMVRYAQLGVQLILHADSRGTEKFNLELTKRRSQEVTKYLLDAGIEKERIISDFVGESQLLNDCGELSDCDELLHQVNRTIEFKLALKGNQEP